MGYLAYYREGLIISWSYELEKLLHRQLSLEVLYLNYLISMLLILEGFLGLLALSLFYQLQFLNISLFLRHRFWIKNIRKI